jgi:hypothetical protein
MKMKAQIINGTMLRENNRRSDETEPKDIQWTEGPLSRFDNINENHINIWD